ncbi:hypothetical protein LMC10_00370, partial [Limosilactobacillus reuteri]|uniref:hypothetical protein n=1 Tax=Limosilactobacillus reuteri TaxID=1598 RepID=UPI001E5671D9
GNYIISGTISCVYKNRMMNCSNNSSSGFYFGLGVFSQPLALYEYCYDIVELASRRHKARG